MFKRLLLLGTLVVCASSFAQAPVSQLVANHVFTIEAGISAPIIMGDSVDGRRQSIPITGGSFSGDNIRGEVLAGGADYQVLRSDGSTRLKAVYMMRTDDGVLINVENAGVIVPPGTAGNADLYFRSTPNFTAPNGKYGWLNNAIFVSAIRVQENKPGVVIIDVYQLQ